MVVQHCSDCGRVVDVKRKFVRKAEIVCSRCKQRQYRLRKAQQREIQRRTLTLSEQKVLDIIISRTGDLEGKTSQYIISSLLFLPRDAWESWLTDLANLTSHVIALSRKALLL